MNIRVVHDPSASRTPPSTQAERPLRVTACQLAEDRERFERDWSDLTKHVVSEASDLVVLPEMPFYRWLAGSEEFDESEWQAAVGAHEGWLPRLAELAPATVIASRPVDRGRLRVNEGFAWDEERGYESIHHKRYLPQEDGYWESTWFHAGNTFFDAAEVGGALVGMQICSDMWVPHHTRTYVARGIHVLAVPRATPRSSTDRWVVGGRATAVVSGTFCVSSNRYDQGSAGFGGTGWIIDTEGEVVATTSSSQRAVTATVDLDEAERAKDTYPRYLR